MDPSKIGKDEHYNKDFILNIIENLPEAIFLCNLDGRIIEANRETYRQLGYTKEEIKKISLNIPVDEQVIEEPIENKDGIKRWYELKSTKIDGYIVVIARDIDKQREIEKKLAVEKENYRRLIESANESIVIAQDDKLVFVNKKTVEITGYTKEEILSKQFLELIHPEDREKVYEYYIKQLKGENIPKKYIFRIIDKFGNIKWVEIKPVRLHWRGKPATLGFIDDITERKKTEEAIKKAYEELEDKVRERTAELELINRKLEEEINRRKKRERDIQQTKELLQNIIDTSDMIIITVDLNGFITTWNKTAEQITGYKANEIIGRKLIDTELFERPYSIKYLQKISSTTQETAIRTKKGKRRLIQFKISPIENSMGILLMGKDITNNIEIHKKLLPGDSYLILDETADKAIDIITNICSIENRRGLILTRGNPSRIKDITCHENIDLYILSEIPLKDIHNLSNLEEIKNTIINFIKKYDKTIILLDRIDYIINISSFQELIETLYHISPNISSRDAILLVRVNPLSLQDQEILLLQEELKSLPYQRIEEIHLDEKLFEILIFIEKQNSKNIMVSYQDVSNRFNISRVTTGKRIQFLIDRGLIEVKTLGRRKILYPTLKGIKLIQRRENKEI